MVKLFCTMAGVEGNPFSLSVDEGDSVNELKMAIKVEKHDTIKCEADTLDLFLAKTENGAWLDEDGAAAVTLDVDGHLQGFEQMDASLSINNDKHFGKNFQPGEGQIHVLVVAPGQQAAFIKKQLRYKRMCTEISCRNFLDALAQQLAMLYT
ncbi:Crinkler (CRN), partial [Phytophthora megakarya]